jgi:hypothetical protein
MICYGWMRKSFSKLNFLVPQKQIIPDVNKAYIDSWQKFNPKQCGLLGGVLFREMKFILSNFLSNEDLSVSYES